MDNLVTAKYFYIEDEGQNETPDFVEILKQILVKNLPNREIDINPGESNPVIVRLEKFEESTEGFCFGELIRKQTVNIPPEANSEGLQPISLSDEGGLAYSSAFIYHKETRTILIQANPIAVPYTRLRHYLSGFDITANYRFDPVPDADAWKRFNEGLPRKFSIRIASPNHVEHLPDTADTVAKSAANIAEATKGAYVTIEVSMGTKRGSLATDAIRSLIGAFKSNKNIDVRSLSTSVKADGSGTDVIDFLNEFLFYRRVIDLPSDDSDKNYTLRKDALLTNFKYRLEYLTSIYAG